MDYMVVISAVVLGLSVLATVAKFLDWFMHSDPRTMIRTTRWMLLLLLLACIPLLVMMIINQQWAAAMLVGAGMLVIPTLLKWRNLFAPLRAAFDYFRPRFRPGPRPFDMEIWRDPPDDPETVRRAAAILEAYVSKASLMALRDERRDGRRELRDEEEPEAERMSRGEALEVLGLEPGADEDEIRAAHKRLLRLVHPDRGGSAYLARRIYEARDALLEQRRKTRTRTGDDE
jgi:hypothetical protein